MHLTAERSDIMSDQFFLCPICGIVTMLPKCKACGYDIPCTNSVWHFCDAPAVKLDGDDKYIGYDNIGLDFEPSAAFDGNAHAQYGVFNACGDLIAKLYGTNITVLDVGAGLGAASIPLAKNDINVIAADVSAVMLKYAAERAAGRYPNLIFTQMNAYELKIADSSIDIVVENAMLHLVDNPKKVLQEMQRVLKPGGSLIRYGSYGLPVTEEQAKKNKACSAAVTDISNRYYEYLSEHKFEPIWFDNHVSDIMGNYFEEPERIRAEGFSEEFTDKMKFRMHRLKTGAHSGLQGCPKKLLTAAWEYADQYAREKYGEDYINIKGFSHYGAEIITYKVRK